MLNKRKNVLIKLFIQFFYNCYGFKMLKLKNIPLRTIFQVTNAQLKRLASKRLSHLTKNQILNGPGLKDFIAKEKHEENRETDEMLANEIFLRNLKNINDRETQSLHSLKDVEKRKVFFEIHGCQMNTNDTEVAYSILDKSGLYERTLDYNTADVILLMTCSIRENAEQKIWNRLHDFTFYKNKQRAHANKTVQIGILGLDNFT